MAPKALAALAITLAAILAGCANHPASSATGGSDKPALAAGKGAISGLLVDDRYRPIHLTDTPTGPYDAKGFILVVETGATVTSDVDGQFQVPDLEPGVFTLKPAVDGHEGAPMKVDVAAGKYAEVDVMVRRLFTPAKDAVSVHDDSLLLTCTMQVTNGHLNFGRLCHGDLDPSGENNFIDYNYTAFGNVSAIVVEVKLSKVGDYEFWLSVQQDLIQAPGTLYRKVFGFGTDYIRFSAVNGANGTDWASALNTADLRIWVNVNGVGSKQTYDATGLAIGEDVTFAVKARLVVSAFLTVPSNLDTYALIGS